MLSDEGWHIAGDERKVAIDIDVRGLEFCPVAASDARLAGGADRAPKGRGSMICKGWK